MVSGLSAAEMWERYKATGDPDVRHQLILQYAPLVKYVVGRMAIGLPGVLDSEDIISHATIGLIDAIERFDPDRGLKFETYAIPRVRGSILDAVRRLGTYPRGTRRRMKEIEAAIADLEDHLGRTPTDEEVAEYLKISVEDYSRELLEGSFAIIPLEGTLRASDDEFLPLSDIIEDPHSPSPPVEVERAELKAALLQAINELPERDRLLMALYYHEELTLKEISHVLEISESRVCQLHARAIIRLRRSLSKEGLLMARAAS
ncbi:MAG: FliA/WhiG family RNA polymerase sigma factor [Dehalococcoidales bacterium]|nr:FliA/WhiG family RNA polymerase sigma factor [Dehalococcoidales bacterium]